jgi:hypothetical protein
MLTDATLRLRQRGAGLIETMVGIVIGLLVVLVVYNLLAVAEGYKRMTTGFADAQITGLIAHFMTGQDAANGGNGLYSAYPWLMRCHNDENNNPTTAETSLKPIPIAITRGATVNDSDSFVSRQSASTHVVWPVPMRPVDGSAADVIGPGQPIRVQSPLGFMTSAKASLPTALNPHWIVTMANDNSGRCGLVQVTNATATGNMDVTGNVELTQGAPATVMPYNTYSQGHTNNPDMVLSLGRVGMASRIRYDVVNQQLRTTDCLDPAGCIAAPNPVAHNVVLMKVQYGIDTSPRNPDGTHDGVIDCWTTDTENCPVILGGPPAINIPDWTPATLALAGNPANPNLPADMLNRMVAVRIGLVVRSDEPDDRNASLFVAPATTIDGTVGTRPATATPGSTYLFNCPADTDAGCPGRVPVSAGAAGNMQNGFRYRVYEAVIPLRNAIFNATLPP